MRLPGSWRGGPSTEAWVTQSEVWERGRSKEGGRKGLCGDLEVQRRLPWLSRIEARERPFRFGNEVALTLDNLGGGFIWKLNWGGPHPLLESRLKNEGHFQCKWRNLKMDFMLNNVLAFNFF